MPSTHIFLRVDEIRLLDGLPEVNVPLARKEAEEFQTGKTSESLLEENL
jgi:hypothetical protein